MWKLYDCIGRGDLVRVAGPVAQSDIKEALQAENERLRQELAWITEQRDILKKAAGTTAIFDYIESFYNRKPPPRGPRLQKPSG